MKTTLKITTLILPCFSIPALAQSGKIQGTITTSVGLFNAKAGVSNKNFEPNFWARNITDKKYVAYGSFGTFLLGSPGTNETTLIVKF